jgi:hypothetical protein
MEQRKVVLSCGPLTRYPVSARVGVILTSCAIEITTVLQFDNIPRYPWFLYFPTSTANGRLTETAILHNQRQPEPQVAFFSQQQTVVLGPCVPHQSTLIFTLVTVYVPSYRQSFILHMHMGTVFSPCQTTVRVESLLSGDVTAQIRGYNGRILSIINEKHATLNLQDTSNSRLHVYLEGYFGPSKPFWVADDQQRTWLFSQFSDRMPVPNLWILKPPARDIGVISFYVSEVPKPPRAVLPAEPQDLLAIAAAIICDTKAVFFVEGTPCITVHSDERLLRSLSRKVHDLVAGGLFYDWINPLDWSWRNEIQRDPNIDRLLAVMGL